MKPSLRPSDALTRHSSGVSNTRLQTVRKGRNRECLAGDAQAHPCGARYSAIPGLIAPRQGTPGPGPSGTSVGRVSVIICRTAVARTAVARTDVARIAVALTSFGTRVELARTDEGIRFDGRYEARDGLIASAHGRACSGPAKRSLDGLTQLRHPTFPKGVREQRCLRIISTPTTSANPPAKPA